MTMQVVKLSRKILKPYTPTPLTLRYQKLGFIDEYAASVNVSLVLFFSVNSNNNPEFLARLETSLEKILTYFKPLAGRYVEKTRIIDCNDQGVEFIQAGVNVKLQDLLDYEVNTKFIDEFMPCKVRPGDEANDPLLSIQVTTFECGSVALGLSFSHKAADASTMSTFVTEWAAMSRDESEYKYKGAGYNSFSLFPSRGLPSIDLGIDDSISDDVLSNKVITLKYLFNEKMITNLKEKVVRDGGSPKWSRVQLISALIAKGLTGVDRAIHDYPRDCIVIQPINLREKTASLIPKDSCGNIWGMMVTECKTAETTIELAKLLTDSAKRVVTNYSKIHHDTEECQTMVLNSFTQGNVSPMANVMIISSWCKFPFYEADFGFGKPIWVSGGSLAAKNIVYLIDGVGGNGVEAYICLETKDVPHFEKAFSY